MWAAENDAASSCQTISTSTQHDPMVIEMVNSLAEQMTKLAAAVADFKAERIIVSQPTLLSPPPPPPPPPQRITPIEALEYRQCWTCGQHGHIQRYCSHRTQQRQYQRQYQRPSGDVNPPLQITPKLEDDSARFKDEKSSFMKRSVGSCPNLFINVIYTITYLKMTST